MNLQREPVALVEHVAARAVREINALESGIAADEGAADAKLWAQAALVVEQLAAGLTQRELARQWINVRTGEPYSQSHVVWTKRTFEQFTNQLPRPRFRDAYNEIANRVANQRTCRPTSNPEWYTPADYIDAARAVLGAIDLDPASCDTANAVVQAERFYTKDTDALTQPWSGRVWMNPPYAIDLIPHFAEKFAAHVRAGDISAGIVLTNNCTDTAWFAIFASVAEAWCFLNPRVKFWHPEKDGSSPLVGQVLTYAGPDRAAFCRRLFAMGLVVVRP